MFLVVAASGSFSAAAKRLRVTQPTVSRRIAAFEGKLGHPLFRRDIEGAHLTEPAERLFPAAEQMARWAGELGRLTSGFEDAPKGVVRIAAPPGVAFELLAPFAKDLRTRLPEIRLEVLAGIDHIDLSRGQADLALRLRAPTQPDLMEVAKVEVEVAAFVSAKYEKPLCEVKGVGDLDWITWSSPYEHLPPRPQLEQLIPGFFPAFASNDYIVQLRAFEEGLGAMFQGKRQHRYLKEDSRREVPLPMPLPASEIYLVCAKSMRFVARVRAVIDELLALFEGGEGLDCDLRSAASERSAK
jgi:DNA-binding transcriptional LysR family regulator